MAVLRARRPHLGHGGHHVFDVLDPDGFASSAGGSHAHAGAGLAFRLPLDKWLKIGEEPGWLRVGARTSLAPHLLDSYVVKLEEASDLEAGSAFDRLAWSFGLMIPY